MRRRDPDDARRAHACAQRAFSFIYSRENNRPQTEIHGREIKNRPKVWCFARIAVTLQPLIVDAETKQNNITLKQKQKMIVVPVKEGENIERALKKFKRKFEKTGVMKELRARQQFDKPSVLKRLAKERAIYVQQLNRVEG